MIGRFKRLLKDRSGHFALLTAITAPVSIVLAAVAVDTGSLYVEHRRAQSLADLAAISAASNLDKPGQAALGTLSANGVNAALLTGGVSGNHASVDRISMVTGRYNNDPTLPPSERFVPGATSPNAARVTYRTIGTRYFGTSLIAPPEIIVSGLAATSAEAAFSIGSRLASLEGGLVNQLLGQLLGSNITLSAMDYDALLSADVNLLSFLDALATELDLTAGSYSEVLDSKLTVGQIAKALSESEGLTGSARAAAAKLATQAGNTGASKLKLSSLIDIGEVASATIEQLGADVSVMEIISLSAILAGNGKQVALDLGANVPGLLAASLDLAIGEPAQNSPWFRIGSGGELVRTAQTRLALTVEIGNGGSLAGLLGARIRIPLYLELAYGEARLKSVTCPTGRPDSVRVSIDARPGIANLYLAEVNRSKLGGFNNPVPRSKARLIQIPAVSVTGMANAEMSNIAYTPLTFSASDISAGKVKKVTTKDFVSSLTKSLFSSLSLDVKVELGLLGLPLISLPNNVTNLLGNTIGAAAPAIDGLLNQVLALLGLSLGQAEIRVHGANCGRAVLVQ